MTNEAIDIYNENRELTGLVLPRKTKLGVGQYMLYVYALIEDNNGNYLITRRSLDKKWAAGQWEVPGGGAMSGESSLDAICREVEEETGLNIKDCPAKVAFSYRNDDENGDNYFADVYIIKKDFSLSDVKVQEEEVLDVKIAGIEQIQALYEEQGFLHYSRIKQALNI